MRILNVLDFDGTITKISTNKDPFLTAEENTKQGLKYLIKHNEDQLTAIASYNDNVDYILSYLLPFLEITKDPLPEPKLIIEDTYKLSLYFLNETLPPLIIATITINCTHGKNRALQHLTTILPKCDEYHFYDDDPTNISFALKLSSYHCHLVTPDQPDFQVDERKTLIARLVSYKKKKFPDTKSNSFYSSIKRDDEFISLHALLSALNNKEALDSNHFDALNKEGLKNVISTWELQYSKKIEDLINKSETLSFD